MKVLVVEDDKNASKIILNNLRNAGFTCDATDSGEDAFNLLQINLYDVVLLDMMLVDSNGSELIRRLRACKNDTPIMVISALNSISEKVMALTKGADDYLSKPASIQEIIARIHAIVRRKVGYSESVITLGKLSIDLQTKTATAGGFPLKLTSKEYSILQILMLKKGRILNKEEFLNHLYDGSNSEPSSKIIDVFVCKLRKKIETVLGTTHNYIETVWGCGYMCVDPHAEKVAKG